MRQISWMAWVARVWVYCCLCIGRYRVGATRDRLTMQKAATTCVTAQI